MPQLLFQKQDLAWLVNRKWALAALFGEAYAAQFAPLDEEALQTAALALFHEAIAQGRFSHGSFIEERLEELLQARSFCEQVPYTLDFEAAFAPEMAGLDLLQVADYLYLLCLGYTTEYPSFFQPAVDGYQYLLDVLVRAQHQQLVAATPSLARAQDWLRARLSPAPAPPGTVPTQLTPARRTVRPAPPRSWADVVLAPHTPAQVEELLLALALLERTATGQLSVSAETVPGEWVGALTALREAQYVRPIHADVAKVLHACYGPVVRERTLQAGVKLHNRVHQVAYQRAQAWLQQRGH